MVARVCKYMGIHYYIVSEIKVGSVIGAFVLSPHHDEPDIHIVLRSFKYEPGVGARRGRSSTGVYLHRPSMTSNHGGFPLVGGRLKGEPKNVDLVLSCYRV